jgi:hypothetical protein
MINIFFSFGITEVSMIRQKKRGKKRITIMIMELSFISMHMHHIVTVLVYPNTSTLSARGGMMMA